MLSKPLRSHYHFGMSRRTVTGPAERRATREREQHDGPQQNFHLHTLLHCSDWNELTQLE
jgi:hypothetical protein